MALKIPLKTGAQHTRRIEKMRGHEIVELLKKQWLQENPGMKFTYTVLADALNKHAGKNAGMVMSRQYLNKLREVDGGMYIASAEIIASYAHLNINDLHVINKGNPRRKPQPHSKKYPETVSEISEFCRLAVFFISQKRELA